MKKITSILLSFLLTIGACSTIAVSATETETVPVNQEMLTNGTFDMIEEGELVAWDTKADDGGSVVLENDMVKLISDYGTGDAADTTQSVRIWNYYPWVKHPNGVTVISGKIKIDRLDGASYVTMDSQRKGFGDANSMKATLTIDKVTDGWTTFETTIGDTSASSDGKYMFYIRLFGTGTVYIDDISIQNKERLLKTGTLGWRQYTAALNVTHGYISDPAYTGPAVTPYSGDDCFYQWPATNYSSPRPYTLLSAKPVAGATYRISMRFKPSVEEATYVGPRMEIIDSTQYTSSGSFVKLGKDAWTVENVSSDGWNEISAYFTMPENTATNYALRIWAYYGGWIDDLMIERDYEEDMEILSSNYESIESATPGQAIKLKAHIISDKTAEQGGRKVKPVVARYAKNGDKLQCVDVLVGSETVNMGTAMTGLENNSNYTTASKDITVDYVIPADAAGQVIKAFLWDGVSLQLPVGGADTITVSAN